MTPTPFHDIAARARAAAVKGQRLHLEVEHARALAQHPEIQALLGRLIAEENATLCRDDPNPAPPQPPAPAPLPPIPSVAKPPGASASGNSTSIGAPIGSDIASLGMMPGLVQDAESSLLLVQAKALKSQSQRNRRSQRTLPPTPPRLKPRSRPRPVSQPSSAAI